MCPEQTPPRWRQLATALLLASAAMSQLAAAASAASGAEQRRAPPPFEICYDYGCRSQASVALRGDDWQRVRELFAIPALTGAEEREQIAAAIALLEQLASARSGIGHDLGGNIDGHGQPGQMDCIDESTNTTAYLRLLAADDLLIFHRIGARVRRAPWIFDPHWAATLIDRDGRRYAVDSWFLDNGRRPYVQALPAWLDKAELPYNPDARGQPLRPASPPDS